MAVIKLNNNDIKYIVNEIKHALLESVYISNIDKKKKNASLTYKRGRAKYGTNQLNTDLLATDKMEENNGDTYEVTLKGGVVSYNITSIRGTNVMHYFKNCFSNKPTKAKINDDEYDLIMEDSNFKEFMERFKSKVGFVIQHYLDKIRLNDVEFSPLKISIYPVPSSSNFNITMANLLAHESISGLQIQTINKDLLVKDLRLLQRDEEFIGKNKLYYSGNISNNGTIPGTVEQNVDNDILKYKIHAKISPIIKEINIIVKKILLEIYNYRTAIKQNRTPSRQIKSIVNNYKKYIDLLNTCKKIATYKNPARGEIETNAQLGEFLKQINYSKGPSIENRTNDVWGIIKPYLRGEVSPISGKPYTKEALQFWQENKFEIKTLTNGERMGLKNIYNPNTDEELVKNEVEKIKDTILVIFDDNISGGATLSDVCYQCKELGIEHIVPITFGKMAEKWTVGRIVLNLPVNNNGEKKKFNY